MVGFMIKNIRNLCFIIFILILASTLGFASASSDTAAIDSSGDNLSSIAIADGDGAGLLEDSNVNLDNDVAADSKDNDDLTLLGNSDDGDSIYESGNDDSNLNQADFNYSLNSINEDRNLKSQDVVYISPDGDEIGSGSQDDPTTWDNAINLVGDNGTIVFLDGEYLLSNQFLDKNLTLKGLNSNAVISDTTFVVNSDNVLNIENLIFTDNEDYVVYSNGTVNVKDSTFANNSADVLIQSKNANIVSSNFTGNNGTSVSGGNITIDSSNFINNNNTPVCAIDGVVVRNSSFINNTGKESGALYSVFNAEVYDSEFINNSALIGGAVNAVHNLTVENSNFEGNNASAGSAVLAKSSDIKDSNFTNNTAIQGVVSSADLNIDNCVFDNNTAVSKGVIYTENATVKNSKFNDNEAEDDITILALNELNEENNDINPDEIEVVQTTQMSWEFDDNQMMLENGDIAYCIQKSNPVPYGGVYLFESLDFVLSQITGEDVSQYLKILISQNLENEDHAAIQEAIWIFTDGDYENSDNELVKNVLIAYDDGTRISTQNAKVLLSNGTLVSLNFKATTRADAQNLLAYNISELGVPNMTIVKKSLNPVTDLRELAYFEIEVANTGEVDLSDIVVNESYSSYLKFISWESLSGDWSSSDNKSFSLSNLDVGQSASFKICLNATGYGNLTNTVNANSAETGVVNASNNTFVPTYALTVNKKPSSIDNIVNDTIYYNITVENSGNYVLHDVIVTDILPDGDVFEYLGVSESNAVLSGPVIEGSNVTFRFEGDFEAGETFYVVLMFKANKNGTDIINTAFVESDKVNKSANTTVNVYNAVDFIINKTACEWWDCQDYNIYPSSNFLAYNFTVTVKNTGNTTLESLVVGDFGIEDITHGVPKIEGYIYRNGVNETNGERTGYFNYTLSDLAPGEIAYVKFVVLIYTDRPSASGILNNSAFAYYPNQEINKTNSTNFTIYRYTINKTAKVLYGDYTRYGVGVMNTNWMAVNFTAVVRNTGPSTIPSLIVTDYGFNQQLLYSSPCPEISGYVYRYGHNESNGRRTGNFNYTLENLAPGETAYVDFFFLIYYNGTDNETTFMENSVCAYEPTNKINMSDTNVFPLYKNASYTINKTAKVLENFTNYGAGSFKSNLFAVNFTVAVKNTGQNVIERITLGDYGFDRQYVYNSYSCPEITGYIYRNGRYQINGQRQDFNYTLFNIYPGETAYVDFLFLIKTNNPGSPIVMNNSAYGRYFNQVANTTGTYTLVTSSDLLIDKNVTVLYNYTLHNSTYFAVNYTVTVENTGNNIIPYVDVEDFGFDSSRVYRVPDIKGYVYRNGEYQPSGTRTGDYMYTLSTLYPGEKAIVNYTFYVYYNQSGSNLFMNNSARAILPTKNVTVTKTFEIDQPVYLLSTKIANVTDNQTVFDIYVMNVGYDTLTNIIVNDTYVTGIYKGYSVEESSSQFNGNINMGPVEVKELENAVFSIVKLDPFSGTIIHLYFQNNETGTFTNHVNVTGTNSTGDEINTSCEVNYTVSSIPTNISIAKETVTPTVHLGDQAAFDIIVSNDGDNVEELNVEDRLFDGMIFDHVDPLPDGVIMEVVDGIPIFNVTLNPHSSLSFRVYFNTTRTGNLTNMVFTNVSSTTNYVINASNKTEVLPPEYALDANKTALNKTVLTNETTQAEFNITVSNTGLETLKNIVVSESQFDGLEYVSFDPSRSVGDWSVEMVDGKPVFKLASLDSGDCASLIVVFNATREGNLTNIALVVADNVDQETVNATVEVIVVNDAVEDSYNLSAVKAALNKTVDRNITNETEFNITVSNTGNQVLTNVVIEESMFKGLKFVSFDEDLSSEGWIVDLSGDKPVFKLESLDVGASANLILKFNVTKTGNITNVATVYADNVEKTDVNDTIQSILVKEKNIKPPISAVTSDFSVEKIATNNTVALNELVCYDIIVRNDGNDILHNIVVSDLPDEGLVYVSSPDEDGWHKVEGDGLKFVLELLKPGQSSVLKVCFNATKLGTLNNNASVSSDEKNGTNSTETIEVKAYNMTVVKEVVTPAVYLGDQVIFDIVVNNTGGFDLEGIVVNDTGYDESALSLASYKSIKGSWSGANGIYSLSGALAPGETAVIRLTFDTLKAGSFNNTAVATSDKIDDVNSTNSTVVYNPDLSIEKIANNDVVHVGDEVSFTLIVKNTGDCNLTGFYVIDRDHKGLTYKGFVDDSGLWKFDGKDTWVYSGTLQPGETASFDVLFTAVSEGVKTNTAIVGFGDRNMSNATNETTVVPKNSSDNGTSEDDDDGDDGIDVPPSDNSIGNAGPKIVKGLSLATGNPIMALLICLIAMFSTGIYTRKR